MTHADDIRDLHEMGKALQRARSSLSPEAGQFLAFVLSALSPYNRAMLARNSLPLERFVNEVFMTPDGYSTASVAIRLELLERFRTRLDYTASRAKFTPQTLVAASEAFYRELNVEHGLWRQMISLQLRLLRCFTHRDPAMVEHGVSLLRGAGEMTAAQEARFRLLLDTLDLEAIELSMSNAIVKNALPLCEKFLSSEKYDERLSAALDGMTPEQQWYFVGYLRSSLNAVNAYTHGSRGHTFQLLSDCHNSPVWTDLTEASALELTQFTMLIDDWLKRAPDPRAALTVPDRNTERYIEHAAATFPNGFKSDPDMIVPRTLMTVRTLLDTVTKGHVLKNALALLPTKGKGSLTARKVFSYFYANFPYATAEEVEKASVPLPVYNPEEILRCLELPLFASTKNAYQTAIVMGTAMINRLCGGDFGLLRDRLEEAVRTTKPFVKRNGDWLKPDVLLDQYFNATAAADIIAPDLGPCEFVHQNIDDLRAFSQILPTINRDAFEGKFYAADVAVVRLWTIMRLITCPDPEPVIREALVPLDLPYFKDQQHKVAFFSLTSLFTAVQFLPAWGPLTVLDTEDAAISNHLKSTCHGIAALMTLMIDVLPGGQELPPEVVRITNRWMALSLRLSAQPMTPAFMDEPVTPGLAMRLVEAMTHHAFDMPDYGQMFLDGMMTLLMEAAEFVKMYGREITEAEAQIKNKAELNMIRTSVKTVLAFFDAMMAESQQVMPERAGFN